MLIITCISFGKNDNGDNITTEAKGMLRFIWNDHGKYSKSSKFPITGFENNGTAGFAIYLEFTPEDKEKFMNNVLIVWPGNTDGKISGREMYNRILNIGKEISPDIESKMKKERRIKLKNMDINDAICAFEDDSFKELYNKRQLKFFTHNNRTFSLIQEFREALSSTFEESFNYEIEVDEVCVKNKTIFQKDSIKKYVEGIFTGYMYVTKDE